MYQAPDSRNSTVYINLFLFKFKFETNFSKSELKFPITNVNSSNLGENLHTWQHCQEGKSGLLLLCCKVCKHFGTNNRNFHINMYDE